MSAKIIPFNHRRSRCPSLTEKWDAERLDAARELTRLLRRAAKIASLAVRVDHRIDELRENIERQTRKIRRMLP